MGYELNRLMRQYGVSTPSMANYAGAVAGERPNEPVKPGTTGTNGALSRVVNPANNQAYATELERYNTDLAAWNARKAQAEADTAAYNQYRSDYQNRLQNTPMYLQSQFQRQPVAAPTNIQGLYQTYLGRDPEEAGLQGWTRRFADPQTYLAQNPDVAADPYYGKHPLEHYDSSGRAEGRTLTPVVGQAQREEFLKAAAPEMNVRNIPTYGQNIYNGTGSYWGNQLSGPTYAQIAAPATSTPVTTTTTTPVTTPVDTTPAVDTPDDYSYQWQWQGYAAGGRVKTHFQTGGINDLGEKYDVSGDPIGQVAVGATPSPVTPQPDLQPAPLDDNAAGSVLQSAAQSKVITPADAARVRASLGPNGQGQFNSWLTKNNITVEGGAPQVNVALNTAAAAEGAPKAATPPADAREAGLNALLSKYGPGDSIYAPELKAARERATKESDAFAKMLQNALANPEDAQTSKAEMYFRLAAAFGSPTKTGKFTENLAMAGKEMGEYAKGKRESAREKLALQLKAQELRMGSAKDELATLRTLSAEEMKDKRAIATQLIKEYVESGKPQSAAGKQALDEGLVPGTPEFQKRVAQIAEVKVDQQMASINAMLGNLAVAQAGLTLRQQQAGKLSPAEVQMKRDTEDSLAAIGSAMRDIGEAYRLNPSTFDTSAVDTTKRKALELAGSKDPKLVATRTLENLLKSEMITSAAEKMKGVLSDSDIKLLQSIQGLDAKSVEERANILRNAYAKLKNAQTRQQRRLEDIGSGLYGRVSGE